MRRVCRKRGCNTILAADNPSGYCSPCDKARWDSPYWEGREWLLGPEVAAWIKPLLPPSGTREVRRSGSSWVDNLRRACGRWKRPGSVVELARLEPFLIELDLHPADIPAHCWSKDDKAPGKSSYPKEFKEKVLRDYAKGMLPVELAQKYGVPEDTITNWRRAAGLPSPREMKRKVAA